MKIIDDKPLLKSMISERMWQLKDIDAEMFKREVKAYCERGYPGWTIVRAKYPLIYLRDDRNEAFKTNSM